jgi:hypothetical protein
MYNLIANRTREQAIEKATVAARKTMKRFAVLMSEYTGCTWAGLAPVQQRASAFTF